MTDQREQQPEVTNAIPAQPTPPAPGPWADYLAAAQRLDAVRRAASSGAGEQQAAATAAARQELSAVREQLATQSARLIREFGLPEGELRPQPADLDVAMQAVADGPAAVLAALQQAHRTTDAAAAMIVDQAPPPRWRPWARNLLVYGPFAAAVLLVQIALYLVAPPGSVPTYALLCGLSMPVLAFGLGWVTIGFVYGGEPGGVDRTPIVGAIACLTPVLLTCMGVGLAAFFR